MTTALIESSETLRVAICESQPLTALGVQTIISRNPDLQFAGSCSDPEYACDLAVSERAHVLLLDRSFGEPPVLGCVRALQAAHATTACVVWATHISDSDTVRLFQAGSSGVLLKNADPELLLKCLRHTGVGGQWLYASGWHRDRAWRTHPSALTSRERDVLLLVEKGLRNSEVADRLGICTGTVKIHLKHIFEKTGVHGRHELALAAIHRETVEPGHEILTADEILYSH